MAIFPDLIGFRPVTPERRVDWTHLFDATGSRTAARAKKIDGRLVGALIALPVALTGENEVEELQVRSRCAISSGARASGFRQARRSLVTWASDR